MTAPLHAWSLHARILSMVNTKKYPNGTTYQSEWRSKPVESHQVSCVETSSWDYSFKHLPQSNPKSELLYQSYIFTVDKTCWSLSWHQISTKSKILPTERKITDLNPEGVETIWAQVSFQKRSPTTEVYASGTQATLTSLQTKPGSPEDYAGIWVDIGFVEGMRRSSFLFSIQHFFFQLSSVLHICLSFSACLYLSFLSPLTFSLNHADKSSGLLAFSSSCEKKKKKRRRKRNKSTAVSSSSLALRDWKDKSFPWQTG